MTCPECNGWRLVGHYGWQNDGHGRQEFVYMGRIPCSHCRGIGVVTDPDTTMQDFMYWLEAA